jgi:hypothetical protein
MSNGGSQVFCNADQLSAMISHSKVNRQLKGFELILIWLTVKGQVTMVTYVLQLNGQLT